MHTLLLSDLHLPPDPSPLRDTFRKFLEGPAREAAAVYLLGDLFEYWMGDDVGLRDHRAEAESLRQLADSGVKTYYMHGNRDFMLGKRYAAAAGFTLLEDPLKMDLGGVATLLSHGDLFCTDDVAYQRWRKFSRGFKLGQAMWNASPEFVQAALTNYIRRRSSKHKVWKAADIMDVNEGAVQDAFRTHGVTRIIQGHTHRPKDHHYEIDGRKCTRIVMADWHPARCEVLRVDDAGVKRVTIAD
jgi:UDP-2,3-diacylglucosamine hydrolase